jgi:hypothetical protein
MAERKPSDDKAAFGVFPQLNRNRAKQDREAAKSAPVDLARGFVSGVAGAPGDLEAMLRIPYDYLRAPTMSELVTGDKTSKTFFPTSHDIEKHIPFKSDTPVSRAATGLGQLGGNFYNGPLSPLRVIGALPSALKHGAEEFAKASVAGAPHVIKPSGKGANWLGGQRGSVEAQLGKMKMADYTTPEQMTELKKSIDTAKRIMGDDPEVQRAVGQMENELSTAKRNNAVNSWIDSNLRNYVKNQMATPDDPVRKLAEEGILHMAPYGEQGVVSSRLMNKRMGLGQDPLGMGRSDPARFWERMSDISVDAYPAGSYKHGSLDESLLKDNPWLQKIPEETMIYSGKGLGGDLGFDHIIDVLRQDVREGRIRPEQLNKVSMEQAVRRVHEYDQEMARKMAETQAKVTEGMPVHKEYPEGYKWIELALPKNMKLPEGYSVQSDPITNRKTGAVDTNSYRLVDKEGKLVGWGKTEEEAISSGLGEQVLKDALKYEGETMGHCVGGYCPDVVAGKSRIYSLRDTKGEPHVTVEVQPNQHLDYNSWFNKQPEEIQNKIAQRRLEDKNHNVYEGPEYLAAREALAPRIVQVKGKQNRAPKEDYLPYVQDFVRGGNWSQVGDLQNTGLIRKSDLIDKFSPDELDAIGAGEFLTKGEHDDLLLKALRPPLEGMKRGGVVISNNPDTMMLDLQNKKQSGGSVKNKVKITDNKDSMWLATQDQKFGKGGKVAQIIGEGLEALGITKRGMEGIKQLSPEEKAVLEKWGQKQAQEAERAKKVEKMAKDSASKSPEESVKPAKASTGKRTATPPDFYRKMAETQGDEAVLRAARAGKHLKPDTSGGYIGAPRTVDSPQALGKMRRDLDQDFIDSVDAVRLADPVRLGTWYDRAKSGMAQMTEPYQLPRTLEQHGVYSAGVAPESELTFALKHLNSRNYGEPKMAYRGAGMRTLDRAVAADEPAEMGFKIGEYADKNNPRLPNTGLFGVNDFRRAQGMGYTDPQGNPWKAGVSDTMHPFMDLETALQVDRANKAQTGGRSDWYGPHIQELPWVYGKAQDIYSRGSSKTGRYGGDPLEGIKMALQDANKTAIDYAYKHAGSATHEAIPGASTGHVPSMINAPLEERIAYGNTGRWDRPVPEAALSDFPEVGAGNRDAIYSALGYRQLPTIEASGAYLPEGASAFEMQPVKIARPLLDFPTGGEGLIAPETKQLMDFSERFRALNDAQEAFGYNLPNTMGDVGGKTSAVMDTRKMNPNRNLDPATGVPPTADQMGALTSILGDSGYGVAPTSRGATIFPFDAGASPKDMAKLLKSRRDELQSIYPSEVEASLNSSGYGPGVGKYTPEGFTASEPFSGQATKGLLKEASYLPQSAVQNLSESEYVRQALKEKMARDAALPEPRADIQNTRKFFAEADWAKAVDLIRKGMSPTAALAALGYSASSMAGEADR